jgi:hypothetical protein
VDREASRDCCSASRIARVEHSELECLDSVGMQSFRFHGNGNGNLFNDALNINSHEKASEKLMNLLTISFRTYFSDDTPRRFQPADSLR